MKSIPSIAYSLTVNDQHANVVMLPEEGRVNLILQTRNEAYSVNFPLKGRTPYHTLVAVTKDIFLAAFDRQIAFRFCKEKLKSELLSAIKRASSRTWMTEQQGTELYQSYCTIVDDTDSWGHAADLIWQEPMSHLVWRFASEVPYGEIENPDLVALYETFWPALTAHLKHAIAQNEVLVQWEIEFYPEPDTPLENVAKEAWNIQTCPQSTATHFLIYSHGRIASVEVDNN